MIANLWSLNHRLSAGQSSKFIWPSGLSFLPFPEPKKQSISTLEREWDTQSVELGTSPSCGGLRSVVRTRHQPGRSLGRSNSSTVWPGEKSRRAAVSKCVNFRKSHFVQVFLSVSRKFPVKLSGIVVPRLICVNRTERFLLPVLTDISVLHPAVKSWRTTVNSQPPESCKKKEISEILKPSNNENLLCFKTMSCRCVGQNTQNSRHSFTVISF